MTYFFNSCFFLLVYLRNLFLFSPLYSVLKDIGSDLKSLGEFLSKKVKLAYVDLTTSSVGVPFSDDNSEPHWMDLSKKYRFGMNIDEQWSDHRRVDNASHRRPYRSQNPAGFFPNGQNRWSLGSHWRDRRVQPFAYSFLNPGGDPATPFYNLATPHCRSMFEVWKHLTFSQPRRNLTSWIIGALFLFAATAGIASQAYVFTGASEPTSTTATAVKPKSDDAGKASSVPSVESQEAKILALLAEILAEQKRQERTDAEQTRLLKEQARAIEDTQRQLRAYEKKKRKGKR